MERYEIKVKSRTETGKGAARKLRRNGFIPGVAYGKSLESIPLVVNPEDIRNKVNENAIIDLEIEETEEADLKEEIVMIKDYQKDVINDKIIHVDFQQISMDEKINVDVPVNLVGTSVGVEEGGVLQQLLREIEVSALPDNVPEKLDLDISEMEVGDSLQIKDLEIKEDIEIVDSLEEVIVTVVTPTEEVEEEVELEEEFIEPEVIGEEELEEGEEVGEEAEAGEEEEVTEEEEEQNQYEQ